jgi:hypothetical protein
VVGVREGWWTGREPGLRDERAGQAVTLETNYPDPDVPRDLRYATILRTWFLCKSYVRSRCGTHVSQSKVL